MTDNVLIHWRPAFALGARVGEEDSKKWMNVLMNVPGMI